MDQTNLRRRRVSHRRIPLGAPCGLLDVVPTVLVLVPLGVPSGRHRWRGTVRGRGPLWGRGTAAVIRTLLLLLLLRRAAIV